MFCRAVYPGLSILWEDFSLSNKDDTERAPLLRRTACCESYSDGPRYALLSSCVKVLERPSGKVLDDWEGS